MDDARLFLCARCQRQVLICSRCDRGQQLLRGGAAAALARSVSRYAPRGVVTSNRAAAGTAMPSANGAIGAGAAKGAW